MNKNKVTSLQKLIEAFKKIKSEKLEIVDVIDFEKIVLENNIDYNTLKHWENFFYKHPSHQMLEKFSQLSLSEQEAIVNLVEEYKKKEQVKLEIEDFEKKHEEFNKKLMDILTKGLCK